MHSVIPKATNKELTFKSSDKVKKELNKIYGKQIAMADLNPTIPIITLHLNGLNISINNQRLSNYILKHSAICCL